MLAPNYCYRRRINNYHVIYHPTTKHVLITHHPFISDSKCRIIVNSTDIVDTLRNLRRYIVNCPIVFFDTHYPLSPISWFHFVESLDPDEQSNGE